MVRAFDANAPDMIVTMMIEDVKGRGGSNVPGEKNKTCISEIILNYKVNFSLNLLHVCLTQRYKLGKYRTIKFQKAFFLIENAFAVILEKLTLLMVNRRE